MAVAWPVRGGAREALHTPCMECTGPRVGVMRVALGAARGIPCRRVMGEGWGGEGKGRRRQGGREEKGGRVGAEGLGRRGGVGVKGAHKIEIVHAHIIILLILILILLIIISIFLHAGSK